MIAHTCKFRPARIPMREAGLYRIRPPALRANISRTTRKRVADDPGNVREGSRGKKINGLWRAGWFNRDKTPHRSYRDRLCTITKIVARARNAGRECSCETR